MREQVTFTPGDARILRHIASELRMHIVPDYSGRGMFGTTCFGIEFAHPSQLIRFGYLLRESPMSASPAKLLLLETGARDTLGTQTILYFPWLAWPDEEESETEDEYEDEYE